MDFKSDDSNDEYADRGFRRFGRLLNTVFRINRHVESKTSIDGTEYTFTAHATDWQVNTTESVEVELSISPSLSNGVLFYRPSSHSDWEHIGTFSGSKQFTIPADDMMGGSSVFLFHVESEGQVFGELTLRKPTYKLSPARPTSFTVTEPAIRAEMNGSMLTANASSHWQASGKTNVSVNLRLDPPLSDGVLLYRPITGDETQDQNRLLKDFGEIFQEVTVSIPAEDIANPAYSSFEFTASQGPMGMVSVCIPRPPYPIATDSAEVAMASNRFGLGKVFW